MRELTRADRTARRGPRPTLSSRVRHRDVSCTAGERAGAAQRRAGAQAPRCSSSPLPSCTKQQPPTCSSARGNRSLLGRNSRRERRLCRPRPRRRRRAPRPPSLASARPPPSHTPALLAPRHACSSTKWTTAEPRRGSPTRPRPSRSSSKLLPTALPSPAVPHPLHQHTSRPPGLHLPQGRTRAHAQPRATAVRRRAAGPAPCSRTATPTAHTTAATSRSPTGWRGTESAWLGRATRRPSLLPPSAPSSRAATRT